MNCNELDKRTKAYKECIKNIGVKEPIEITHGGLGDIVEKMIESTGLDKVFKKGKDCGCDKRKKKLNTAFPARFKARCLTEQEYNDWDDFMSIRTLRISNEQVEFICRLYSSVFNRGYYRPCPSCSPKPLISMIEKLDKVHAVYKESL